MIEPVYRRVLGERFALLPNTVQLLHDVRSEAHWRGEGTVERGTSLGARLLAWLLSLPEATSPGAMCPVHVAFTPDGQGGETWTRQFEGASLKPRPFISYQWEDRGFLVERVGVTRFTFALEADKSELNLVLHAFHVLGVPVPRFATPRVRTAEREANGRYTFDVEAHLPLGLGLLVAYRGWLVSALEQDGAMLV